MKIGQSLKYWRENAGLTQMELSQKTGLNQSTISRWEKEIQNPAIEYCIILAEFYGISIDELVGHEVKKNY